MNVLTLTLNPSIDHILSVDRIHLHTKNILFAGSTYYGGKGINVAYALGKLHIPTTALGLVGEADKTGYFEHLAGAGVRSDLTPFAGMTRQAFKIMESATGMDTEFNMPGASVPQTAYQDMLETVSVNLKNADWMVLCGSVPAGIQAGIYSDIIRQSAKANVRTLLDTSGQALLVGVETAPDILRINQSELTELVPDTENTLKGITRSVQVLHGNGIAYVIVSLGAEGSIGFDGASLWKASIPAVAIRSLTGAGDAMTAGLITSFAQGRNFSESLRFASALATASTLQLAPGDFLRSDLEKIHEKTVLEKLTG